MGCWEETCALTLLPIYSGQQCVMIVMDAQFSKRFENSGSRFYRDMHSYPNHFKSVEAIHKGAYDDYGWIEGVDNPEEPDDKGVERPLSNRRVTIFVHRDAWDAAVAAGKDVAEEWARNKREEIEKLSKTHQELHGKPRFFTEEPPTEAIIELYAVAEVAYWTRRDLFVCETYHGAQSWKNHHYDLIHNVTQEIWKRIEAEQTD